MPLREQSRIRGSEPASTGEADGAVPAGYRLGDGWEPVDPKWRWVCTSSVHGPIPGAVVWRKQTIGAAEYYDYCCQPCAIQAGALVPLSPPGDGAVPVCKAPDSHDFCSRECGCATTCAGCSMQNPPPIAPPAPVPVEAPRTLTALEEIDDILSSFGQLGRELVTFEQIADGSKHSESVPKPADEIVYKALRRVRALKAALAKPAPQPAEPAKAPLSERLRALGPGAEITSRRIAEVAALEAEVTRLREQHASTAGMYQEAADRSHAARAEVEQLRAENDRLRSATAIAHDTSATAQGEAARDVEVLTAEVDRLRGKLAESDGALQLAITAAYANRREADARVLAAYKECARVARERGKRVACGAPDWVLSSYGRGSRDAAKDIADAVERLPISTGTASETSSVQRALQRVPLWDAINEVVSASGGDPGNSSVARQRAVVAVERVVDALIREVAPQAGTGTASPVDAEVERLKAKLAEVTECYRLANIECDKIPMLSSQLQVADRDSLSMVRGMREAAANVVREQVKYLESIDLTEFGDGALNKARTILAAIEALPDTAYLDTEAWRGRAGEEATEPAPQADAGTASETIRARQNAALESLPLGASIAEQAAAMERAASGAGGEACVGCLALLDRAAEMLAEVQEEPDGWQEWCADLETHKHAQDDAIKAAVDKERERCLAPLREWFIDVRPPGDDEDEGPTCAKCAVTVTVGYGLEWEDGDVCDTCAADLFQVVAKLLRDSGAPAPGAGGEGGK